MILAGTSNSDFTTIPQVKNNYSHKNLGVIIFFINYVTNYVTTYINMKLNIINELEELAIGARMKRLYDTLSKDVMKIYAEHNLDFETKYFTLFYLIGKRGEISIMEIAEELSLSHPGVINLAKDLEKKGYIESVKAKDDNRKRLLRLSKKGVKALPEFEKVWNMIYKTNKLLFAKQQHHLLRALEETEALLEKESYYKRFKKLNP